jgi:nanoRNase/pAp phosphatase (c-di-AMP/oligoRNAs hydrolase)
MALKAIPITKDKLSELDKALKRCGNLLILIHDYPDPDALASALLLSYLAGNRHGLRSRITYGGVITRAENRAMVQQLKIKLTHVDKIRWGQYSCIAMVDTQPAFGNHSLPEELTAEIVIDHHPRREPRPGGRTFADIRTEYGATATMLLEYLAAAELEVPVDIATAVAYAIRSETQELGRDTSPADIDAYVAVYPIANKRKLAKIFTPKLAKSYFLVLYTALQKARVFRHLARVHLGVVETPEFVPQVADLLLQRERIGWSIATGRFEGQLYISLRCTHPNANAGNMLRQIIGKMGFAGGHPMVAGGRILYNAHNDDEWQRLEDLIINRFLRKLGIKKEVEWKSMLLRDGAQNE